MQNPIARTIASLDALAHSSPNTPVRMKAVTAVGLWAEAFQRIHHKGAGTGEGERHPEDRVERLGDREAAFRKNVGQPGPEPERDAEKRKEADHSGDDPAGIVAEHGRDRIAVCAARRVDRQALERDSP
jgi:hypothetical protein